MAAEENNSTFEGISIMSVNELKTHGNKEEEKVEETVSQKPEEEKENKEEKEEGLTLFETTENTETPNKEDPDNTSKESKEEEPEVEEDKKTKILKLIAKELSQEGLIPEVDEEFDGSLESLKSQFEKRQEEFKEEYKNTYKENFSGAKKRFLEIEAAFNDETLAMQVAEDLEFFNTVTKTQIEEDENVQKAIYSKYLYSRGHSQQEVNELLEEADAVGKLEDKAQKALPALKTGAEEFINQNREQREKERKQAEEQRKQTYKQLMDSIESRDHVVEGLPFTKVHKEKLKKSMSEVVYTDENGRGYNSIGYKQHTNPTEFEVLLHYFNDLGLFNVNSKTGKFEPDFSKIKKKEKTNAAKELDNIIADEETSSSNKYASNGHTTDDKRQQSILSLLKRGMET